MCDVRIEVGESWRLVLVCPEHGRLPFDGSGAVGAGLRLSEVNRVVSEHAEKHRS